MASYSSVFSSLLEHRLPEFRFGFLGEVRGEVLFHFGFLKIIEVKDRSEVLQNLPTPHDRLFGRNVLRGTRAPCSTAALLAQYLGTTTAPLGTDIAAPLQGAHSIEGQQGVAAPVETLLLFGGCSTGKTRLVLQLGFEINSTQRKDGASNPVALYVLARDLDEQFKEEEGVPILKREKVIAAAVSSFQRMTNCHGVENLDLKSTLEILLDAHPVVLLLDDLEEVESERRETFISNVLQSEPSKDLQLQAIVLAGRTSVVAQLESVKKFNKWVELADLPWEMKEEVASQIVKLWGEEQEEEMEVDVLLEFIHEQGQEKRVLASPEIFLSILPVWALENQLSDRLFDFYQSILDIELQRLRISLDKNTGSVDWRRLFSLIGFIVQCIGESYPVIPEKLLRIATEAVLESSSMFPNNSKEVASTALSWFLQLSFCNPTLRYYELDFSNCIYVNRTFHQFLAALFLTDEEFSQPLLENMQTNPISILPVSFSWASYNILASPWWDTVIFFCGCEHNVEWLARRILPIPVTEFLSAVEENEWLDPFDDGQIRIFHLVRAVLSYPARRSIGESEDPMEMESVERQFLEILQSVPAGLLQLEVQPLYLLANFEKMLFKVIDKLFDLVKTNHQYFSFSSEVLCKLTPKMNLEHYHKIEQLLQDDGPMRKLGLSLLSRLSDPTVAIKNLAIVMDCLREEDVDLRKEALDILRSIEQGIFAQVPRIRDFLDLPETRNLPSNFHLMSEGSLSRSNQWRAYSLLSEKYVGVQALGLIFLHTFQMKTTVDARTALHMLKCLGEMVLSPDSHRHHQLVSSSSESEESDPVEIVVDQLLEDYLGSHAASLALSNYSDLWKNNAFLLLRFASIFMEECIESLDEILELLTDRALRKKEYALFEILGIILRKHLVTRGAKLLSIVEETLRTCCSKPEEASDSMEPLVVLLIDMLRVGADAKFSLVLVLDLLHSPSTFLRATGGRILKELKALEPEEVPAAVAFLSTKNAFELEKLDIICLMLLQSSQVVTPHTQVFIDLLNHHACAIRNAALDLLLDKVPLTILEAFFHSVIPTLGATDFAIRSTAVQFLSMSKSSSVLEGALNMLQNGDLPWFHREALASVIGSFLLVDTSFAHKGVKVLIDLWQTDPNVHASILDRLGSVSTEVFFSFVPKSELYNLLRSEDQAVRTSILIILKRHCSISVSQKVVEEMLLTQDPKQLLGLLMDEKYYFREVGLKLVKYMQVASRPLLFDGVFSLLDDKNLAVRKEVVRSIVACSIHFDESQRTRFVSSVLATLSDKASSMKVVCLKAFRKVGGAQDSQIASEIAKIIQNEKDIRVRRMALLLMAKYDMFQYMNQAGENFLIQLLSSQLKSENVPLVAKVAKNINWLMAHEKASSILHIFPVVLRNLPAIRSGLKKTIARNLPSPDPHHEQYISSLLKLLDDDADEVKLIAVRLLSTVMDHPDVSDAVTKRVVQLLRGKDLSVRKEALRSLSGLVLRRKVVVDYIKVQKKSLFTYRLCRVLSYNWSTSLLEIG